MTTSAPPTRPTGVALPHAAPAVWETLADLAGHHRWVPLTTTDAPPPPPRPGDRLTAVTAGVLVDRMLVTRARPPLEGRPGVLTLEKIGPILLGPVRIVVAPAGPAACTVDWREHVHLAGPLPRRLTAALLRPVLTVMTRLALRRVAGHLAGPNA